MYPELFRIPIIDVPLKSYGLMLMLGFLTAIWIGMRRAERVKANPDTILNMGLVALICGVLGARLFYVIHYWNSKFAYREHPLFSAFNTCEGGLEYYGGLLCAIVGALLYLRLGGRYHGPGDDVRAKPTRRPSLRLYMDIVAPVAMWGLAFGRMGCLLNGCCWGGLCLDEHGNKGLPWAIRFPFGSPAYVRQWEHRQVHPPAELIYVSPSVPKDAYPLYRDLLSVTPEDRLGPERKLDELNAELAAAKERSADSEEVRRLSKKRARQERLVATHEQQLYPLNRALQYPSRIDPTRTITMTELRDLAAHEHTRWVHPAQVYGIVNALMLSLVLTLVFYRRKRHGVVFGIMVVIYPITRVILEVIRSDNPHDSFGLTISQAVSVVTFAVGVLYLVYLYKWAPLRSPRAVPFAPPSPRAPEEAAK